MKARLSSVIHKPLGTPLVRFPYLSDFQNFATVNFSFLGFFFSVALWQTFRIAASCPAVSSSLRYKGGWERRMIHSLQFLFIPSSRMSQGYCSTVLVSLKNVLDWYDSDKSRSDITVSTQYLLRQNSC